MIKSFAQYTDSSIVNVPLSKVSTNSELMSIFFDRKYRVEGSAVPGKLGFKDVIFVMEDVDAASKVVKRRDGRKPLAAVGLEKIDLPMPESAWRMFRESISNDCIDLVKILTEKPERLKKEADTQKPEVLRALAQRVTALPALALVGEGGEDPAIARICEEAMESANTRKDQHSKLDEILSFHAQSIKAMIDSGIEIDDKFVDELLGDWACLKATLSVSASKAYAAQLDDEPLRLQVIGDDFHADTILDPPQARANNGSRNKAYGPSLFKPNPDQLSLSGLLNVLDGVVDTPGRILVMTTNHPEMLESALIRPGRIDKKTMLGSLHSTDIICMLLHYFQTALSNKQVSRVETAVNGDSRRARSRLNLTPAQVEQMAAEYDDLDDMICFMEKTSCESNGNR